MRQMGDRPVLLQRFPNGAGGSSFFQKRVPDNAPDWLATTVVSTPNGTTSRALVIADLAHLIWAVNLGCLGFHSWPCAPPTSSTPTSSASTSTPSRARRSRWCARRPRACGPSSTSSDCRPTSRRPGNRGIHVYLRLQPRWDSIAVRAAAVAVARELERRHPSLMTAAWWKEERGDADLRRLQPERAPQDGLRAVVRAGPQMAPVSMPDLVGRARRRPSRRSHDRRRARTGAPPRRSVGADGRRAQLARTAPRSGGTRPGQRPDGRAVAPRLSEDGGGATARRSEPGPQDVTLRRPPADCSLCSTIRQASSRRRIAAPLLRRHAPAIDRLAMTASRSDCVGHAAVGWSGS